MKPYLDEAKKTDPEFLLITFVLFCFFIPFRDEGYDERKTQTKQQKTFKKHDKMLVCFLLRIETKRWNLYRFLKRRHLLILELLRKNRLACLIFIYVRYKDIRTDILFQFTLPAVGQDIFNQQVNFVLSN